MKELFISLLWIIFIIDSVLLVLIVLLQSGRGGGLSGMLGGGGMAESALGPKSGLPKITGVMAAIFFGAAILISIMSRPREAMNPRTPKGGKAGVEQPAPTTETKVTPKAPAEETKAKVPEETKTKAPEGAKAKSEEPPKPAEKTAPATSTKPRTAP